MSGASFKRITRENKAFQQNPPPGIIAHPLADNIFEWHFTIKGVKKTEFEGGRYHGKFILPSEYPFKAPDIIMLNKSGRFEIGKKICLNFTGYHHELWQPSWTIRTMLTALRAFMETQAQGIGAMQVDKAQRKIYARQSVHYECTKCNTKMKQLFLNDCSDEDQEAKPKPKPGSAPASASTPEPEPEPEQQQTENCQEVENANTNTNTNANDTNNDSNEDADDVPNMSQQLLKRRSSLATKTSNDSNNEDIENGDECTLKRKRNDANNAATNTNTNTNTKTKKNKNKKTKTTQAPKDGQQKPTLIDGIQNKNKNKNNNNNNNIVDDVDNGNNNDGSTTDNDEQKKASTTDSAPQQSQVLDMIAMTLIFIIVAILIKKFSLIFWKQL